MTALRRRIRDALDRGEPVDPTPARPPSLPRYRPPDRLKEALAHCAAAPLPPPGLWFDAATVRALRGFVVYAVMRQDVPVYVGMGQTAARPLSANHPIAATLQPDDVLWLWPMPTLAAAQQLETRLIYQFKPEHNVRGTGRARSARRFT